jgi:twinkle protein
MEEGGIIKFVNSKGWQYKKVANNNIGLKHCPFCEGKSNKTGQQTKENEYTFYIDLNTGLYNCFRGNCGAKGHINMLATTKVFEGKYQTASKNEFNSKEFINEVKELGKFKAVELNEKTLKMLADRKISIETLHKTHCRILAETGDLIIPCYENGLMVNYKRRFLNPTGVKTKNSSKGKSTFYGMQNCYDTKQPLIIVEGEMDMLAIIESGHDNVVSVPNGAGSVEFVEECYEFLDGFEQIIIWFDNDKAGNAGFEKLKLKLDKYNLYRINSVEKDANDELIKNGKDAVKEYIANKEIVELDGIIFNGNVARKKIRDLKRVASGIYGIDFFLRGFRENELTIWSGKNASGKSTLLGQIMLNLIQQKEKIFAYSGELSVEMFKEWLYSQACSKDMLFEYTDEISKTKEYEVRQEDFEKIENWIGENLIIYNKSDIALEEEILPIMKKVHHKYGCRHFFLDNLMMMQFEENEKDSIYLKQSRFVKKIKGFVTNNNSHCHLVVHPYKTDKIFINKDDIGGHGDIVNSADNVLIMHNTSKNDKEDFPAKLTVEKNRIGGRTGDVPLAFEYENKRFYTPTDEKERHKKYGWLIKKLPEGDLSDMGEEVNIDFDFGLFEKEGL